MYLLVRDETFNFFFLLGDKRDRTPRVKMNFVIGLNEPCQTS